MLNGTDIDLKLGCQCGWAANRLSRPGQGDGESGVGGRERVLCELQRVPQAYLHQEESRAGPGHTDGGLQVT